MRGFKVPKYQRSGDGARVWIAGAHTRLPGAYGSPESRAAYKAAVDDWERQGRPTAPLWSSMKVDDLAGLYREWLATQPASVAYESSLAVRQFCELYPRLGAEDVTVGNLEDYRTHLLARGLALSTTRVRTRLVLRMFRWACNRQYITGDQYHHLTTMHKLRVGMANVRPTKDVLPVSDAKLEATLQVLPPTLAAMVRVHRLTGMRSEELCNLTPGQIDRDAWVYCPVTHKTAHHGHARFVAIGPRARAILEPRLPADPCQPVFSPLTSVRERYAECDVHRRPKQAPTRTRTARKYGDRYTPRSYCRAIKYACEAVWPTPKGLTRAEAKAWRREHWWHPHQLRHAHGTEATDAFGIDAAAASLGHADSRTTIRYAKLAIARQQAGLRAKVAEAIG